MIRSGITPGSRYRQQSGMPYIEQNGWVPLPRGQRGYNFPEDSEGCHFPEDSDGSLWPMLISKRQVITIMINLAM